MELREYDLMRAVEDSHWWYRSLHAFVGARLGGAERVLDVGCGTGGMLARFPAARSAGIDLSPAALAHARRRGLTRLARASACDLPFPGDSFDAVLVLDVLYHRAVTDEAKVLAECRRVARPGGLVMIHAAAHRWLSGTHDRAVHGARRHTASGIRTLVLGAGLEVVELTYRNALALPWAVVSRGFGRVLGGSRRPGPSPRSDLSPLPAWLNRVLGMGARAESTWLGRSGLPAGLSVWCVGRKP